MATAWRSFEIIQQPPKNTDWAHARCLNCARLWTWNRRALEWHDRTQKVAIYQTLCPACYCRLTFTSGQRGYRRIPNKLLRFYLRSWHGERP
jgi:hypothetical protein